MDAGAGGEPGSGKGGSGVGGSANGVGGSANGVGGSRAGGAHSGENPGGAAGAGGDASGNPAGAPNDGGRAGTPSTAHSGEGGAPHENTGGASDAGAGGTPHHGTAGAAGSEHDNPGGGSGAGGEAGAGTQGDAGAGGVTTGGGAGGAETDGGEAGAGGAPDVWIEPVLSNLVVAGAQVPLKPVFSADRARYSFVPRSTGAGPAVTATAADGLTIQINGVFVGSGENVPLTALAPGSAFDVVVTNASGAFRSYNVQYLPAGFPDLRVNVLEPGASQHPIYVSLQRGVGGSTTSYVTKFDNAGVPLHYRVENIDTYDFKRHAGGSMSYARGRQNTEHLVLDANFEELSREKTVGLVNTDVHDFHILPNGNRILMAYEPAERDLTPYGGTGTAQVKDAVLQEVDPLGTVLFQWNSWGVLPYDQSVYPDAADYAHVNSIELATDGNWLVSVRGFSQVVKLDRNTGAILWRLGGIANEFTFLDDPRGSFCGQHTASQLENGNILIFDNGNFCWPETDEGPVTRVVEYEIDEVLKTARLVWSYTRPGTVSNAQGSAQRLANGNTFIGWGSNTNVLATEVDPSGTPVFEVQATSTRGGFVSYRARRFAD